MKIISKIIIAVILLFTASTVYSQSLVLDISYYRAENDMNKSSRTETFSINGYNSAYTLAYTGRVLPNEADEIKTCELSTNALDEVISSINQNNAADNEVFYAKEKTNGSETFYIIIKVKMIYNGTTYEIILDGEANLVKGNRMYLNVIGLIKDLRRIIKNC
ncbi:MAG: hypothetical protein IT280_03275 [Ignavibacteria bacterium]|nr:hypothetical protein [Ignavibacteria bacterium]